MRPGIFWKRTQGRLLEERLRLRTSVWIPGWMGRGSKPQKAQAEGDTETRRKAPLASANQLLHPGLCAPLLICWVPGTGLQAPKHHPHHTDEGPRAVKEAVEPLLPSDHERETDLCVSLLPK